MKLLRIYAYIFVVLLSSSRPLSSRAAAPTAALLWQTEAVGDSLHADSAATKPRLLFAKKQTEKPPLLRGFSAGFDLCGAAMALIGKWGQYEGTLRAAVGRRFYPVIEGGLGVSDHTGESTGIRFKVSAPYFRLGLDYDMCNTPSIDGRIFLGARYAFSAFKYSVQAPAIDDPYYETRLPVSYDGLKGFDQWIELCGGLEAHLWGPVYAGWSLRYKLRISDKKSALGSPWYVPGYGRNDGHALGGSFTIVIDISHALHTEKK